MQVVIMQLTGVVVFCLGVLVLGLWLRRRTSESAARGMSVVSHVLFHAGLSVPMVWRTLGGALLAVGAYFVALSNVALMKWGRGMASFVLSKKVVEGSFYRRVRNPLALGWYLMCLGVAFYACSTYLILYLLLGHIPAHVFYLKFFEERELAIRFGESYEQYKQRVSFLIPQWKLT